MVLGEIKPCEEFRGVLILIFLSDIDVLPCDWHVLPRGVAGTSKRIIVFFNTFNRQQNLHERTMNVLLVSTYRRRLMGMILRIHFVPLMLTRVLVTPELLAILFLVPMRTEGVVLPESESMPMRD